jgi:isopenicillin N synthase-like dioxygenase
MMGPNIFPPNIPDEVMKVPTETYYAECLALGTKIMEILAKGLPYGNDVFVPFMSNDPVCSIRLLHYPPQKSTDARQLGAGAHTDFGKPRSLASTILLVVLVELLDPVAQMTDQPPPTKTGAITLLWQDMSGGLEVLNEATGAWVPVTPNPDAYVVNIGDMLALWTKGAYHSNTHRVVNRGGGDRYSVPFFVDGNPDVRLAPLDGSAPCGGAEVITAEQHMLERFGTTFGRATKQQQQAGVPVAAAS